MSLCTLFRTFILVCCFVSAIYSGAMAQPKGKPNKPDATQPAKPNQPRLVVGIIVDQMRPDYLYRYSTRLGNQGLKKLTSQGTVCTNTQFNYVPTYTAPGHASVYSGATPSVHGIIGNSWYDKTTNTKMYCTEDPTVSAVGGAEVAGKMSPRNMLTTTITDELKLASNFRSKVIAVSLKDRGAILPAGHTADAAYWYDGITGNFMTSTFYRPTLPNWANRFNQQQYPARYQQQNWETLYPIATYTNSQPDNQPYEEIMPGETAAVFPHRLPQIAAAKGGGFEVVKYTPFGNTLVKDFAIEAIKGEELGKNPDYTDFIAISFSSTDIIGHLYGPRSVEIEDTYLRFDQDIADLLKFLDEYIGLQHVLIFLTADHAVADVPEFLLQNNIPSGNFNPQDPIKALKSAFYQQYADSLALSFSNSQLYLNPVVLAQKKLSAAQVQDFAAAFMLQQTGVAYALPAYALTQHAYTDWLRLCIQNGFYPKRSGDVAVALEPAWMENSYAGTTHGSSYTYDAHVPLYWHGWKIPVGKTIAHPIYITDIAPTLTLLLKTGFPNGSTGKPILPLIEAVEMQR